MQLRRRLLPCRPLLPRRRLLSYYGLLPYCALSRCFLGFPAHFLVAVVGLPAFGLAVPGWASAYRGGAQDPDLGGQPPGHHLIRCRPPGVLGEHRDGVGHRLELTAQGTHRTPYRGCGMIEPLDRPLPAHRGHGHPHEEGSEQDRAEHDRQKGRSESATQSHTTSWKRPSLERC
ncbi:hypothetical protein GCM10010166_06670 [Couchioplanes caeruleus subsp. azureus]|nr:hypothetical protein GCM10010166_06670 [Couchioplanes caeruleus subsp. azureus]